MINIEFKRNKYTIICDGCDYEIQPLEPSYMLEFGVQDEMACQTIVLCESCGNHIQNDMADEYDRFVRNHS